MTWRVFPLGPVERHAVEFAADELTTYAGVSSGRPSLGYVLHDMQLYLDGRPVAIVLEYTVGTLETDMGHVPVDYSLVVDRPVEVRRPRGLFSVACDVTLSNQRVTVDQILETMEAVMAAPAYEPRLGLSWRCPSCHCPLMGASWALVGSRCPECKANP